MKTMFRGIIKEVRREIRPRQMKRAQGGEERGVEKGGERMKRWREEGKDYPGPVFAEPSFPLLPRFIRSLY